MDVQAEEAGGAGQQSAPIGHLAGLDARLQRQQGLAWVVLSIDTNGGRGENSEGHGGLLSGQGVCA